MSGAGTLGIHHDPPAPGHPGRAQYLVGGRGFPAMAVAQTGIVGKINGRGGGGPGRTLRRLVAIAGPALPGGTALRAPLLVLAMTWYSLREPVGHLNQPSAGRIL